MTLRPFFTLIEYPLNRITKLRHSMAKFKSHLVKFEVPVIVAVE